MGVLIQSVQGGSPAAKKQLKAGDLLLSINRHPIADLLDYDFYAAQEVVILRLLRGTATIIVKIKKGEYQDLGLSFASFLMDEQRSCRNNCVFCFIDQMPKGMRESLYFKDDDDRLSFLFGNYITLTNLGESEIDRIIDMHISPINVSVHTTNPQLRVKMMNNRFAGDALAHFYRLAAAGVRLNCQLVLCPGYNDGEELAATLRDLFALYPSVGAIACVPVGLTKHRAGLSPLRGFTQGEAAQTIAIIESFSTPFLAEHGLRLAYPADEFFIKAERALPSASYYDDFLQLENGVGMLALQQSEFEAALEALPSDDRHRKITLATGVAAAPQLQRLVDTLTKKCPHINCKVIAVENDFFGHSITVAGLLTGGDILRRLANEELGEELLLPASMLRQSDLSEEACFLDDVTLDEVKAALQLPVRLCSNDGAALLQAILGE